MGKTTERKRMKQLLDILIFLCGVGLIICLFRETKNIRFMPVLMAVILISVVCAICDFVFLCSRKGAEAMLPDPESAGTHGVQRLVLLDEQGKPIKSWDLQGQISLIIGKAGQDQELDIDLADCEYSGFIDFQHAVLNFCQDEWYVEDLESQNGVKIRKVEDGECYRVIHRPCKLAAGDVLYIANTKLLLT